MTEAVGPEAASGSEGLLPQPERSDRRQRRRMTSARPAWLERAAAALTLLAVPVLFHVSTRLTYASGALRQSVCLVLGSVTGLVLMMLPGFAMVTAFVRWKNAEPGPALRTTAVVAGSGVVAWFVFWVWATSPIAGAVTSGLVYLVAVGVVALDPRAAARDAVPAARALGVALGASLLATAMFFMHGGLPAATEVAQGGTFVTADNAFPQEWAERIIHHQDLRTPALGGWSLAERPPVQTAYQLPGYALAANKQVAYQLLGSLLESLAVVGVALIMLECGIRGLRLALAVSLVTCTTFITFNTIFLWPKLLPAGLLLMVLAVILEADGPLDGVAWTVVGATIGLSIVGHPGGFFALPALAVVIWREKTPLPRGRSLGRALMGLAALVVPWVVYRSLYDHSSSELLKWHLAGVPEPDSRSLPRTILDQYRALGLGGWFRHRMDNLTTLLGPSTIFERLSGDATDEIRTRAIALGIFRPLWSGGLLLLASPVLVAWRRLPARVVTVALSGAATIAIWTVIEYGPPSAQTTTHSGPYASFLLLSIGIAAAVAILLPRWALVAFAALQAGTWLWILLPVGGGDYCAISGACEIHTYPDGLIGNDIRYPTFWLVALLGAATLWVSSVRLARSGEVGRRRSPSRASTGPEPTNGLDSPRS